jgi:glycosyltransferase involved in cell wall biosynthesis
MALGRPVVSTRLGAEGLPVEAGEHYFAAEDANGFATALAMIARATAEPRQLAPVIERARVAAEPLFWDVIAEQLTDRYLRMLEHAGHR